MCVWYLNDSSSGQEGVCGVVESQTWSTRFDEPVPTSHPHISHSSEEEGHGDLAQVETVVRETA